MLNLLEGQEEGLYPLRLVGAADPLAGHIFDAKGVEHKLHDLARPWVQAPAGKCEELHRAPLVVIADAFGDGVACYMGSVQFKIASSRTKNKQANKAFMFQQQQAWNNQNCFFFEGGEQPLYLGSDLCKSCSSHNPSGQL